MEMPKNNIHESIEELKNIPSGSAFTNLLSIYKVVSDSVAAGYAQGYDRKRVPVGTITVPTVTALSDTPTLACKTLSTWLVADTAIQSSISNFLAVRRILFSLMRIKTIRLGICS